MLYQEAFPPLRQAHALVSASPTPQPVTILPFLVLHVHHTLTSELSASCQARHRSHACHCPDLHCSRFLSQGFTTAFALHPVRAPELRCDTAFKSILPLGAPQSNPVYQTIPVSPALVPVVRGGGVCHGANMLLHNRVLCPTPTRLSSRHRGCPLICLPRTKSTPSSYWCSTSISWVTAP